MNEAETINVISDRRTLAFYGTLLVLLVLDIILLFVVFNPFTRQSVKTDRSPVAPRIAQRVVVAPPEVAKPSPFTLINQKSSFKVRKVRLLSSPVNTVQ